MERVARLIDQAVPEGERWHRELLSQAAVAVPRVRPPVLPADLVAPPSELLAFRDLFRHAYGVVLGRPRIEPLLRSLAEGAPRVAGALGEFDASLAGGA